MKRVVSFGLLALAALAVAQSGRIVGAVGRGGAGNAEGRRGEFMVDVKKAVVGTEIRLDGRFQWSEVSEDPANRFHLGLVRPAHLAVNDAHTVCEFDGPARLVHPSPKGPVTIEGRLQVRIVDRRDPNGGANQDRDIVEWHFVSPPNNVDMGFQGLVGMGDANVFARVRN